VHIPSPWPILIAESIKMSLYCVTRMWFHLPTQTRWIIQKAISLVNYDNIKILPYYTILYIYTTSNERPQNNCTTDEWKNVLGKVMRIIYCDIKHKWQTCSQWPSRTLPMPFWFWAIFENVWFVVYVLRIATMILLFVFTSCLI